MHRLVLAAVGAAALTITSAASAAVTVLASSGLNNPDPTAPGSVVVNSGITTINFGQNPLSSPTFTGWFTYMNSDPGLYSFVLGSSTIGVSFTSANVSGGGNSWDFTELTPRQFSLDPIYLAASTVYTVSFSGDSPQGGALTGNVTITPAVPEPATWAMMLLGFGAMGLTLRSKRRRDLAQLA